MSQVISKITNRTSVKFYALVLGAALALTPVAALAQNQNSEDTPKPPVDLDGDQVLDHEDNCIPWSDFGSDVEAAHNPAAHPGGQPDTDGDGFGNRCDCDFDNNDVVGMADLGLFTQVAGAVDTDLYPGETSDNFLDLAWGEETTVNGILVTPELMDHNANGKVDLDDLNILLGSFGHKPGPSNAPNAQ